MPRLLKGRNGRIKVLFSVAQLPEHDKPEGSGKSPLTVIDFSTKG
jgi:hypothetical protein